MKNRIFLIIGLLLMVASVKANESKITTTKWDYNSPYNQRPITFKERGIKFYISQNGDVDFRLPNRHSYYGESNYYYKNGKRTKSRRSTKRYGNNNQRNLVRYDYYGRISKVGNVFIHYNYYGKVTNVGSVFIHYRRNRLTRVGNLQIRRDRYGNIRFIGQVKHSSYNAGYYDFYNDYFYDDYVYDYQDNFFDGDYFDDQYEQFEEDDDYYYYRSKTKTSKRSKSGKQVTKPKMIKRKKKTLKGKKR